MNPSVYSTAYLAVEAADYIRQHGALTPFAMAPPALPLAAAVLCLLTGASPAAAVAWVCWVTWAVSALSFGWLAKRWGHSAGTTAGIAALWAALPSHWVFFFREEDALRLFFWLLPPIVLILIDACRSRPSWMRLMGVILGGVVALGAAPRGAVAGWSTADLLPAAELAAMLVVALPAGSLQIRHTGRLRLAALAAIGCVGLWGFGVEPRDAAGAEPPVRLGSVEQPEQVFTPASLWVAMLPYGPPAAGLIASEGRAAESAMWLRALGARYFEAPSGLKFEDAFECAPALDEACLEYFPGGVGGRAVSVSRRLFASLEAIRGLLDVEGLERYLLWADRPERVGFQAVGVGRWRIVAEVASSDLILARVVARPEWRARALLDSGGEVDLPITADPLGFMVLDPAGAAGLADGERRRFEIELTFDPGVWRRLFPATVPTPELAKGEFPRIAPEGIVDAASYRKSPFVSGQLVSVFGSGFSDSETRVWFGETAGETLYAAATQVNVRMPGSLERGAVAVRVESAGRLSYPATIWVEDGEAP